MVQYDSNRTRHMNFVRTEVINTDIGSERKKKFSIMTNTAKIKYSETVSEQHNAVAVCSPTTRAAVLHSIQ